MLRSAQMFYLILNPRFFNALFQKQIWGGQSLAVNTVLSAILEFTFFVLLCFVMDGFFKQVSGGAWVNHIFYLINREGLSGSALTLSILVHVICSETHWQLQGMDGPQLSTPFWMESRGLEFHHNSHLHRTSWLLIPENLGLNEISNVQSTTIPSTNWRSLRSEKDEEVQDRKAVGGKITQ